MSNDKRISSDAMFERLKSLIPNLPDECITLDIELRKGLMAVLRLTRYASEQDEPAKITFGPQDTVEEALAVYNVNDFDDVMNQNHDLKVIMCRIITEYEQDGVDTLAMQEGRELLDELGWK